MGILYPGIPNPQELYCAHDAHPIETTLSQTLEPQTRELVRLTTEPDGPMQRAVAALMVRGPYDRLQKAARSATHKAYSACPPKTLNEAVAMHLILANYARVAAEATHDMRPTSEDQATYMATQMAHLGAWRLPGDIVCPQLPWHDIARTHRTALGDVARLTAEGQTRWLVAKLLTFGEAANTRALNERSIELEPSVGDIGPSAKAELTREKHRLIKTVRRHRQIPQGHIAHTAQGDWTFFDIAEGHRRAGLAARSNSPIQPEAWPTTLYQVNEHHPSSAVDEEVESVEETYGRSLLGVYHRYCIDGEGELYHDLYRANSVAETYAKHGKPDNYLVLRNFVLRLLVDSTPPAQV